MLLCIVLCALFLSWNTNAFSALMKGVSRQLKLQMCNKVQQEAETTQLTIIANKAVERHELISRIVKPIVGEISFDSGSTTPKLYDAEQLANQENFLPQMGMSVFFMFGLDGELPEKLESFRKKCTYTIYVPEATDSYASVDTVVEKTSMRFQQLVEGVHRTDSSSSKTELQAGDWSHFLSLTFSKVEDSLSILSQLRIGMDALELRVDLLEDMSALSLHRQLALLKDMVQLPIVYTVRTVGQIGKFPDDQVDEIHLLLLEGLRAGAEWIDVEGCLPESTVVDLAHHAKKLYSTTSKLLGSLHTTSAQSEEQIDEMYQRCDLYGYADMLKVVTGAESPADCVAVHTVGAKQKKPYIGLCLGDIGSYSRVLNRRFTPVTHELMAAAAPGQLTVKQLMQKRVTDQLCVPRNFFLFGCPIQQSLSPTMHNNAYAALLLPHKYALCEHDSVQPYKAVISDSSFGGASVTIPHKESIMPMLDEVRGAACDIGAVNTIVVENDDEDFSSKRRLIGYNTDWIGIQRPIKRLLERKRLSSSTRGSSSVGVGVGNNGDEDMGNTSRIQKKIGLVVGAGGTARAACYAVRDMGLDLVIANRSPDKARVLAEKFGGTCVDINNLDGSLQSDLLEVVVSTLPAAAAFTLPESLLQNHPVILDAVYKPAKTALIAQQECRSIVRKRIRHTTNTTTLLAPTCT
mmetsp:Transcript_22927/g.38374  ORF Transcript_22927/g.38374 Transcript_22927/m.38374 type:complete len:689 (+) Transcript_22927:68-2134(+)